MFMTEKQKRAAKQLLATLSLHEKCQLLSGKDYWHLHVPQGQDAYMISDGPSGLRKQLGKADYFGIHESVKSICYPAPVTCASTFDRSLLFQLGEAMASDCIDHDVAMLLTPGINHKRSPLGGRNFEYYSEDPYVTGQLASALVQGILSRKIAPCVKHFACNNQEYARMLSDSIVDDRALAEIYLKPFRTVIEHTDPPAVMTAYNKLNGMYCTENKALMDLGRSWGFDGMYISDWGSLNDIAASFRAGLDLEMPGNEETVRDMEEAVQSGRCSEEVIDQRALKVLELIVHHTQDRPKYRAIPLEKRKKIAQEAAQCGIVLLKNENGILPLKNSRITLIGSFARHPRFQGTGSSKVNPVEIDCLADQLDHAYYARGFDEHGHTNEVLLKEALALAKKSETVVICAALPDEYESEGFDRTTLDLPQGIDTVIEVVTRIHSRVVVVMECGAPAAMPWQEKVSGIVYAYLGGSYGQKALANVLLGQCDAQGRLAETLVRNDEQIPWFLRQKERKTSCYLESVYTGYKYWNEADVDIAYPFGYGLSYTTFAYHDFKQEHNTISFQVTNTGNRPGVEIVQIYAKRLLPFGVQKLIEFKKLECAPQETAAVTYEIKAEDLTEYFDGWIMRKGDVLIQVGSSSRTIHHEYIIHTDGILPDVPKAYEKAENVPGLTQEEFLTLCQREITVHNTKRPYDHNVCMQDLMDTGLLWRLIVKKIQKENPHLPADLLFCAPLRILKMNGISKKTRDALLDLVNGHWIKALKTIDFKEIRQFIQENT